MKIVLDASAAMEIIFELPLSEAMRDVLAESESTFAPDLYHAEVGNALFKQIHAGKLLLETAREYYDRSLFLIDEFIGIEHLTSVALRRACALNHSIYDMYYLVLADFHDAHLMTRDKRLLALAKEQGIRSVEFAHYSLSEKDNDTITHD
jgi:predicted nucleic acid-binding protein